MSVHNYTFSGDVDNLGLAIVDAFPTHDMNLSLDGTDLDVTMSPDLDAGEITTLDGIVSAPPITPSLKYQIVEDTTIRLISSTTYVDLPEATITLDQGDGNYLIMFTLESDSGKCDYVINIDGVDIPASNISAFEIGAANSSGSTTHCRAYIENGKVIKIRYKVKAGGPSTGGTANFIFSAERTG